MVQNRVPPRAEWEGDVLVVGIETQARWLWGFRGDDPNPWVLEHENEPGAPWTPTGERLDEFLWHFTVVEAVFGTSYGLGANDVGRSHLETFVAGWTRLEAQAWRWPGPDSSLWVRDDLLAWTIVNDAPGSDVDESSLYSISLAARQPESIRGLAKGRLRARSGC